MLTTYAKFDIRPGFVRLVTGNFHQLSDAGLIDRSKRVVLDDFQFLVMRQEAARIIATHSQRRLRQIVRTETKELRVFRDFIGND